MTWTSVIHKSTTKNASVTINVLNEGTENQLLTITYEEYSDDMSRLVTRRLMRLSQEETDQIAHALKRPASETCRTCAHLRDFDDGFRHFCDGMVDGNDNKIIVQINHPDSPSCQSYQRAVKKKGGQK